MSSAPNMATITASLERSLQNCSINNHHHQSRGNNGGRRVDDLGRTRNPTSSYTSNDSNSVGNHRSNNSSVNNHYSHCEDAALDLNSHISLPYQWEQCLDLKSGEIYYINWRTGMKAKEDPRMSHREMFVDHHYDSYYTEEEEEEEEEDDDDHDDEEDEEEEDDSSSSSSSSEVYSPPEVEAASASSSSSSLLLSRNEGDEERISKDERSRQVLVVAGCKVCLMYFMVPKQVQLCPKCTSAQLLHF